MSSQTIITLTGDEKSAYEAFKRIIDQEAKAAAKAKELGDAAKKAGADLAGMKLKPIDTKTVKAAKADAEALNASINRVKASGQGDWFNVDNAPLLESLSIMGTVGIAIGTATKAWDLYKKAQKEALDSQKENQPGDQRLIQVAADEADARNLIKRADDAALATGVERNKARNILFTARSEGFEPQYEAIMASSRVVDPEAQAVVAGKLPTIFNQSIKPLEAVSMTLKAAQASNLSFEQLGSVAPSAAEGAALVGAGPEETLGVLSVLSSKFKSAETAADRIKAFSAGLGIDPQFKGLGILGAYEKLSQMPEEERAKVLGGSQEMNVGYKLIGDSLSAIQTRITDLKAERADFQAGQGMLRRQNEIAMTVPSIRQQFELDRANVRKEVETERNLAKEATQQEVASKNSLSIVERKKAGLTNRLFTWGADNALSFFPGRFSADDRAITSNLVGDMAEKAFISKPVIPEGLTDLNLYVRRRMRGATIEQARGGTPNTVDAAIQMKIDDVVGQQNANRSFATEYQPNSPPAKADPELLNEIKADPRARAVMANALGDSMERQVLGPGLSTVFRPANTAEGFVSMEPDRSRMKDPINRSFATEYQLPATSIQQEASPKPLNSPPAKADPELLNEIKQAREVAQRQAELLQQQNDLLRQQMNQEPPSATNGPSDIQRQADKRR